MTVSDEVIERCAKAAHEVNKAFCEGLGDTSQRPWDEAADWQRDSARSGVRTVLEAPGDGDSALHNAWMRDKVADGWVYGDVKDAEAKTHPCLVPFAELSKADQIKDKLFRTTVLGVSYTE